MSTSMPKHIGYKRLQKSGNQQHPSQLQETYSSLGWTGLELTILDHLDLDLKGWLHIGNKHQATRHTQSETY